MSFDKINITNKRPNLFLFALYTFLAAAGALFIPVAGYLGWALLPLPATLLVLTGRKRDALICSVLGILFLIFLNYILAAVVLAAILGTAFVYGTFAGRDEPPAKYIAYVFLIFVGSGLLFLVITSALNRSNAAVQFLTAYMEYIGGMKNDPIINAYSEIMGITGEQFNAALEQTRPVLLFVPYLLPGLWAAVSGLSAVFNYVLTNTIGKRYGAGLKKLPTLGKWDMSWYFVWGVIAGIILIVLPTFLESGGKFLTAAGANLLIVFGVLYFVLGIAVVWGVLERFKVRIVWRIIIFIAMGLFFWPVLLVVILGILDIWVDFRKIRRS